MNTWLEKDSFAPLLNMVSIPNGMEPSEDRNDIVRALEAIHRVMPGKLEELIETINKTDDDKISCVIADLGKAWAIQVAEKLRIQRVAFWSATAASLSPVLSIQRVPLHKNTFQLLPTMPPMSSAEFGWTLGPLLASNRLAKQVGHLWKEDTTCLEWLDQQPTRSVIYVAFGSFTILNQIQFQELALGLELTKQPFLWVVRPGIITERSDTYPEGYMDRIGTRGKIVTWAPQQAVLAHPSIMCFLSHCGWNSTLEGMSHGVPFLSWPYFVDQLLNTTYICDIWKIGLRFEKDEDGTIKKDEIKGKVDQVVNNNEFRTKALDLKEKVMNNAGEDGYKNFKRFVEWMKKEDDNGKNDSKT
ncbi:hypothetical protein E3N88_06886 [Mikania micrantha]|uniref:UDP-glycosyltransferases domain-containing protein n=1 Tax=Mikania micrantha TaxID=192012 RepID=A0A5N6PSD6_9ASTR|nr:hypothetical protein E3N88_06886 [Mikania micrantha]